MFPWCCPQQFCRACLDFLEPNTPWLSQLCGKGFFWTSERCLFLPKEAKTKGLLLLCWDFVVVVGDFFGLLAWCFLRPCLKATVLDFPSNGVKTGTGAASAAWFSSCPCLQTLCQSSQGCSPTPAGLPGGWKPGSLPCGSSSAHI